MEKESDNKNKRYKNKMNLKKISKDKKENFPIIGSNFQATPEITSSNFDEIEKYNNEYSFFKKDEVQERKSNLLFEEKKVSIFYLYKYLNRPIDYFFIILALIGSIVSGISKPIFVYIYSDILSDLGNTSERVSRDDILIMMEIVDKNFYNQTERFFLYGIIFFVFNFLSVTFWNLVGQRNIYLLKSKYFSILLGQEQGWFDQYNVNDLGNKIKTQLEQIEMGFGERAGIFFKSITQCITGITIAFITSWKLTLVTLSVTPLFLAIFYFYLKSIKNGIIISRKVYQKAECIAEEILNNIKIVASFANFEFEKERFNEKIELCYQIELKNARKIGILHGLMMFFLNFTLFISFLYGRTLIQNEVNYDKGRNFMGSDVIVVSFCILIGIIAINKISYNIKIIQEACTASSDYFTLCERKIHNEFFESIEKPNLNKIKGHIIFKDVLFKYPSDINQKIILNKLNIEIEPGKKVAFVGEKGCGKSTIINLIERFYEISNGEIFIDNIEIKRYNKNYLRSLIGYVPQEPFLINKSIRDNIIFGREELLSKLGNIDELIQKSCDESFSTEFIKNLPGGLDFIVGIKGNKLSEEQRQKIVLARAILTNPKILILDETFSYH